MNNHISIRVRIVGKVQGVFFRAWTYQRATSLGLSGWVRNRLDGSVETVFSGPEKLVNEMLESCWLGSISSQVLSVTNERCKTPKSGFYRLPTI